MIVYIVQTHLSGSDKDTIKNKIKRDSEDEKLRDLLRWTEGIRKHQRWTVNTDIVKLTSLIITYFFRDK